MSNKNNSGPQDDSGILNTEAKKFYRSCKHSDKLRRFTYTNWCPICEADSSRRRSKSESLETVDNNLYRKRLRDSIKTPSPKKLESSSENNASFGVGDARNILESSRMLRANLCEIPTTYINNCQPQVPSENIDNSSYKYNFNGDPIYSNVTAFDKYRQDVAKLNGITRLHYMSPRPQIENRTNNDSKLKEAYFHEAYKNLSPTKNFINRISNPLNPYSRPITPRLEEFSPQGGNLTPLLTNISPQTGKSLKISGNEVRRNQKDSVCQTEPIKRLLPTPRPKTSERSKLPIRPKTCTPEQLRSDNYIQFKNEIIKPKDITKNKSDSIVMNEKHVKSCYVIECLANKKILENSLEIVREKNERPVEKFVKILPKTPKPSSVNSYNRIFEKSPEKVKPRNRASDKTPEKSYVKYHESSNKINDKIIVKPPESKDFDLKANNPRDFKVDMKSHDKIYDTTISKSHTNPEKNHTNPDKKHTTSDKLHVTPDKLHATPDKLHATSDKLHATPDKLHATSDKLHATPDKLHATPDKLHATPDKLHATPDKLHATPDKLNATPDKLHATPDKLHAAPDKLHVTPDKLLVTPDKLLVTPDKHATPDKLHSVSDKPHIYPDNKIKSVPIQIIQSSELIIQKSTSAADLECKRQRVRPRSDSDNSIGTTDIKELNCSLLTKKAREISPLQQKREFRARSAVKLASIKNRHKISVTKLRKVRNKIAHSVSSDSNLSGSDFEDTENENDLDFLDENHLFEVSGSTPTHKIHSDTVTSYGSWPLRSSLFSHVPPYIKFSSHDNEVSKVPAVATKYFKWKLSNITPIVVRKTLSNTGFRLVRNSNDWTGTWGKHIKSVIFQTLKESQKLNHFPGTFQIGRKDRLWKNLQRLMYKFGMKEFGFIPRTFVLPHDLKLLRQAWERTGMEKWIIKPPASARGTGIRVIHRWAHLPKKKSLVVQQYISNPYLINGSKFDLRLYVLVTSFNPLRIYLYPEGLARFASTKYSDDISTLSDRYMHLTNYSINKLSSHYAANEDANACKGHKWTLSKLWEFLETEGVNTKSIWRSLQQLVIKTMLCGESSISQLFKAHVNSRYNCYELFGVDVLLDERLKPWLLEVNISPSLHSASPLDLHVKGPLVQSLLNLAQFHLSPKMARIPNSPPCLDTNIYSMQLTTHERLKHLHFVEFDKREEYISDILNDLTGDDVRHLITAEDELAVIGNFERIFPTQHTHFYFQFMEPRYYNRLFDAWENRYEKNRIPGVKILQVLCEKKLHLEVAPTVIKKSSDDESSTTSSTTPEITTSTEDVSKSETSSVTPKKSPTSPVPAIVDPTIK